MFGRITTPAGILLLAGFASGANTIPEPDLILYGQVCLSSGPATDQDDVTVTARTVVSGQTIDVGKYHMGDEASASDCQGASDCYVLRIRLETVPTGSTPSATAVVLNPTAPNTVTIYMKQGAGAEVLVSTLSVGDRGVIRRLDLRGSPLSTDIDNNGQTNLVDHSLLVAAWTGPSATSAVSCNRADINRDGHVDLRDYALLQAAFLGSGP